MTCKNKQTKEVEIEDIAGVEGCVADAVNECAEQMSEQTEKSECDKLAEDVALWQDKYMRLAADFDNFRKRTLKEKMDLIEYSGEDVIKQMLSVLDDMDRAVIANEKTDTIEPIKEGMVLIKNKMTESLRKNGVAEIEAVGEKLDTDLHEAIAKFPTGDETKVGLVIDVVEKGYKLKEKVIRFSKVVVGE